MAKVYSNVVDQLAPRFAPLGKQVGVLSQIVTLGTGDLGTGTIDIGWLPRGARVIDGVVSATDMDSGTALVWDLGDSGSTARFIHGATAGQAAATVRFGNDATAAATLAAHAAYTSSTKLYITVTTASGTAVAGTLSARVLYEVVEPIA